MQLSKVGDKNIKSHNIDKFLYRYFQLKKLEKKKQYILIKKINNNVINTFITKTILLLTIYSKLLC
jgi:hypothetical protein